MKIIIVGAGEVGLHLAKLLSQERHDIVVVDRSEERLGRVREALDVMTIAGSGSQLSVLEEAGAKNADMLIAVTSTDEVNFTSCFLANRLGTKKKILRVDEPEDFFGHGVMKPEDLGVDVSPRLATLKVEEPPKRKAGVMVADAKALVEKLKNEAKVI